MTQSTIQHRLAVLFASTLVLSPLALSAVAWAQPTPEPVADPALPVPLQPSDVPPDKGPTDASESSLVKPVGEVAPVSSPGRDVLEACKQAMLEAHAVKFRVKNYATESLKSMSPDTQADVRMLRPAETGKWVVRSTGSGAPKGGGTPLQFDVAWLSVTTEYVDHDAKTVFEKRPREARSPFYQVAIGTKPDDLVTPSPLSKPLGATQIDLEDRATVGGVECDVVRISIGASGKNVSRWSIGVADHFPRKIEKIVSSTAFSGSIVTEFSDVVISPDASTIRVELMRVAVPDGYAQDRPPVPPPPVLQPPSGEAPKDGDGVIKAFPVPGENSNGKMGFTDGSGVDQGAGPAMPNPDGSGVPGFTPPPAPIVPQPALPQMLPAFELADGSGAKATPASLAGKPAVLVFFGAWSLPARQGLPAIEAAILPHASAVSTFGVSVRDKTLANAETIARNAGFTPAILASGDSLAADLLITVFPAVIVADKDGRIVHRFEGVRNADDAAPIGAALATLLGAPK